MILLLSENLFLNNIEKILSIPITLLSLSNLSFSLFHIFGLGQLGQLGRQKLKLFFFNIEILKSFYFYCPNYRNFIGLFTLLSLLFFFSLLSKLYIISFGSPLACHLTSLSLNIPSHLSLFGLSYIPLITAQIINLIKFYFFPQMKKNNIIYEFPLLFLLSSLILPLSHTFIYNIRKIICFSLN